LRKYISKILLGFLLIAICEFFACEKKLKEPPQNDDSLIIVKKDEPVIKKKEPTYSYPPNVKAVKEGLYTFVQIDKMATELGMNGFKQGDKYYYENPKHMIFNPEQIPTIYEHKADYFEEVDTLW
jgi:hypothetical protein